jgi:multidrug efflux system membrane fusion protein
VKRFLLILMLLGAAGGGSWWWWSHRAAPAAGEQTAGTAQGAAGRGGGRRRGGGSADPLPVAVVKAAVSDVPVFLDGLGTVQAFNTINIKAMVDGPLVEVRFTEGQEVRAGDVLARIDPRPYQATLDQAVAKKAQDEANLASQRRDAGRYNKLAATEYTSAQQADQARSAVAQTEALVRQDQASIDTARTQLGYATITAPINGRTGLRQVDQGNIVRAGDANPITVLTQLQPISVVFTLPQQSLPAIQAAITAAGGPAGVEVLALQQNAAGQEARVLDRGQLAVLDNQVDATTGTIKMKATFPNAASVLWPGGFVNVRLLAETRRGVTTVPITAIQRGPRGAFVYVVNDNKALRRDVKLALEDETQAVVQEGLAVGDTVVVDGASRLSEGATVAIAGPDGNAPGAAPQARPTAGGTTRPGRRGA